MNKTIIRLIIASSRFGNIDLGAMVDGEVSSQDERDSVLSAVKRLLEKADATIKKKSEDDQ